MIAKALKHTYCGYTYIVISQLKTEHRVRESEKVQNRKMPSETGQSKEALTMTDVTYKKKRSKGLICVGIFAALMTIATIVLGVLYGIEVSKVSPGT